MRILHSILLCSLCVFAPFTAFCGEKVELVILHVNDTHGKMQPYEAGEWGEVGGLARLSTLIKQTRRENPGRVLFLHAGDILSRGDPVTVYYGGRINFRAYEKMGVDAITPGNGEFYMGIENLQKQAARVSIPFIHANALYRNHGNSIFPPYVIKEVNGIKIGILGLGLVRTWHNSSQKLTLGDPIEVAKRYAPELSAKVDLLIALTHIQAKNDSLLAAAVPELDLIVGGDSHTQLDSPSRIPRANGQGFVPIVQARHYFQFMGRVDIELERDGDKVRVNKVDGRLIAINAETTPDPEIENFIAQYAAPLNEVIARSEIELKNDRDAPSPLGDLVVNAVLSQTRADIAVIYGNQGEFDIKPGDITLADINRIRWYHSRLVTARLTGAQIQQLLAARFYNVAGCRFTKAENQVPALRINGQPVAPAATYLVATEQQIAFSNSVFESVHVDFTGQRVDTALEAHLRRVAVIR